MQLKVATATVAKRAEGQLGSREDETSALISSYSWHWSFCRDEEEVGDRRAAEGKGHGGLTRRRRVNLPNTGMGAVLSGQLG